MASQPAPTYLDGPIDVKARRFFCAPAHGADRPAMMAARDELGAPEFAAAADIAGSCFYEDTVERGPPTLALNHDIDADIGVVGGGFAGLSAALELSARGFSVVVLEARRIASAASGRNGGQILPGFSCDMDVLERALGPSGARQAWDLSIEGMQIVRERATQWTPEADYTPGWMLLAAREGHVAKLHSWAHALETRYGYGAHVEIVAQRQVKDWTSGVGYHGALVDHAAGSVNPLKLALAMAARCTTLGVQIFEESPVVQLVANDKPELVTPGGRVRCGKVVLAANVFVSALKTPIKNRIMSIGNSMIATEPLPRSLTDRILSRRYAACDSNFLLHYYRVTADGRMLWGGGSTYLRHDPENRIESLRRKMVQVYPELRDARIDYAWGGLIDATLSRAPDLGRIGAAVYYLQGFSGHGLNVTAIAGRLVAEAIGGDASRFELLAGLRHRNFPGGDWLKRGGLALGAAYYQVKDWVA